MHGTDHDQAKRRIEGLNEELPLSRLNGPTAIGSKDFRHSTGNRFIEGGVRRRIAHHELFLAAVKPAKMGGRFLSRTSLEQAVQQVSLHVSAFRPPHGLRSSSPFRPANSGFERFVRADG
jgi:hypothetical protein